MIKLTLSNASLYTKRKVSADPVKTWISVIKANATTFEVDYVTNWWQDRKMDCHAMKRITWN